MPSYERLTNVESLYLNRKYADVWFVFGNERIPGHMSVLTPLTDFFSKICNDSWREGDDIDLSNAGYSASTFKEFLRYFYLLDPRLTMDNIDDIINLAEATMNDRILFRKCEDFLIESLTYDTLPHVYNLADVFEHISPRMLRACKEDICLFANQIFRSSQIRKFKFELLEYILRCESLACEEKQVFAGCIAWAKAACKTNKQDPKKVENLRAQLKHAIHLIRFSSMTVKELATCIQPYPGLFSVSELQEIIDMVGGVNIWPKQFHWTPRDYDNYIKYQDRGRRLECLRYTSNKQMKKKHIVGRVETTSFTCNRRVLLKR